MCFYLFRHFLTKYHANSVIMLTKAKIIFNRHIFACFHQKTNAAYPIYVAYHIYSAIRIITSVTAGTYIKVCSGYIVSSKIFVKKPCLIIIIIIKCYI